MFAGHVGAALALASGQRRVNTAAFVAAALLPDLLLWAFILLGWESVTIPRDFAATHQALFMFPWSHGLVASLAWSVLVGALAWRAGRRTACLLAAAVFSHWLLDFVVHRPELPLLGVHSPQFGLALWDRLPWALLLEGAIVLVGAWLFLRSSRLPRGRVLALVALAVALLAFTVAGMTVAPAPPSAQAMAGSSLATLLAVCALVWWLGRARLVTAGDVADDPAQP